MLLRTFPVSSFTAPSSLEDTSHPGPVLGFTPHPTPPPVTTLSCLSKYLFPFQDPTQQPSPLGSPPRPSSQLLVSRNCTFLYLFVTFTAFVYTAPSSLILCSIQHTDEWTLERTTQPLLITWITDRPLMLSLRHICTLTPMGFPHLRPQFCLHQRLSCLFPGDTLCPLIVADDVVSTPIVPWLFRSHHWKRQGYIHTQ